MAGTDVSRSKDALAQKRWEVAFNFVNVCAGNKTASYVKWYEDNDKEPPAYPAAQAHKFFNNDTMRELVEQFRAENRKEYAHIRDENIAVLRSISSNPRNKNSDRTAAIKELNHIMGYGSENLNINGKVDSDIEVVITGP